MTYYSVQNEYYYSDNETDETDAQHNARKDRKYDEACSTADRTLEQMHELLEHTDSVHLLDGISASTLMRMTKQNENVFQSVDELDAYLEQDEHDTEEILYDYPEHDKWTCEMDTSHLMMTMADYRTVLNVWYPPKPLTMTGPSSVYKHGDFGEMKLEKFNKVKGAHEFKDRMFRRMEVQDSCKRKLALQVKELKEKREQLNRPTTAPVTSKTQKKASFLAFLMSGKKKQKQEPVKATIPKVVVKRNFNYTKTVKPVEETKSATGDLATQYIGAPAPKYVKGQSEKVTLELFTYLNKQ